MNDMVEAYLDLNMPKSWMYSSQPYSVVGVVDMRGQEVNVSNYTAYDLETKSITIKHPSDD